ncbi:MAG: arginine N-succinyltransferase [Robiginitomaculum sp.]|nr:MAG: arginine N-succinyltransferase [Robiginitomaculum sp.]
MLIVRPARLDDLEAFIELARLAGPGFTSLAVSDEELEARLNKSVQSFALEIDTAGTQIYLLMLEDSDSGEVVGVSAVKALVGMDKPFFNFKLLNIVQSSSVANRHFNMEVMLLVNEYSGTTEVGTLFVKPKMRGTGAGRLISQARYLLIAAAPNRFAETVISELRGCVDSNGYSPFWESLGRKFFKMDFNEADKITAETDNQFITDLMPKYPIYKDILSDDAQEVIGKTHPDGVGAKRLLEAEGFRYDKFIDIFDAGPTMAAPRDQIRTVKDSHIACTYLCEDTDTSHMALISNNRVADYRAVYTGLRLDEQKIGLPKKVMSALGVDVGDPVRVFETPPSKKEV